MKKAGLILSGLILLIGLNQCVSEDSILIEEEGKTVFTFDARNLEGVEDVHITGDFTGWFPEKMEIYQEDVYYRSYSLSEGEYRFSILIDGEISPDMKIYKGLFTPEAESYEPDTTGGVSAVISIEE